MKKFEEPIVKVTKFEAMDVIATSTQSVDTGVQTQTVTHSATSVSWF